jgi:threonine dehydratase
VAYAARLFGVRAIIAVPENANPAKVASMRHLGAEVVFQGQDFDEAREWVEQEARDQGYRYIHSGNEPLLIAGVGAYALEMLADQPDLDTIIVPVGGGSGAAGVCIVAKTINPAIRVIGVQSEQAPAAWRSWREGRLLEAPMATFAEGLATRTAFELPQQILRRYLDDFILVSDDEIRRAIIILLAHTRNLAEGAGAASLAAALKLRQELAGKRVGIVLSGGNLSIDRLRGLLAAEGAPGFKL